MRQVEELLTHYGRIAEVWIDIPGVLGHEGRLRQYEQIARLQPDAVVMMNHGYGDGTKLNYNYAWPTDLMAIERWLPSSATGYNPWHMIDSSRIVSTGTASQWKWEPGESARYYIPGEVCDTVGRDWFYRDGDSLRSDAELLGMRLICRERRANLLLDVPPDRHGVIPAEIIAALMRLSKNVERF